MALANIHMRNHGGKVERRDARHYAQRLANLIHVDAAAGLFRVAAFEQIRIPQANSISPVRAALRPCASGSVLPCSRVIMRGDLAAVGIHQFAQAEHDFGAARQRRGPPLGKRGLCAVDRVIHFRAVAKSTWPGFRRWRDSIHAARTDPRWLPRRVSADPVADHVLFRLPMLPMLMLTIS